MMIKKRTAKMKTSYDDDHQDSKKWYLEVPDGPKEFTSVTEEELINLLNEAKRCHELDTTHHNMKYSKTNSTLQWMKKMMSKGTISDRIASHTIAIQDNPIYTLDMLKNLVGMVKISKKKECVYAMGTLADLFLENLLIPTRKLQSFREKPLSLLNNLSSGSAVTRKKILSAWYFEDQLKEIYGSFVDALKLVAHDDVEANREKAIAAMYKLLSENAEQESKLLSFIVNKFGDPSQKVASKAIYCLGQIVRNRSFMQSVVLDEVEKLLFRLNVSTKTQYYGLCFLSQFFLSHEECDIAKRLMDVYFGFFNACVKKGEIDRRMMSALLMGVNRAYPYAKMETEKFTKHMDTIYRIVHFSNLGVSLQALNLIFQVSDSADNITDRFYSALYKKLLDPQVIKTTYQTIFLNLVYKSLLKDTEINRIKAVVKRLLQLCLESTPSFACGILYLISRLHKAKDIHSLTQKPCFANLDIEEDEEERYEDIKLEDDPNEILHQENDVRKSSLNGDDFELEEKKESVVESEIKIENAEKIDPGWYHMKLGNKKHLNFTYDAFTRNPLYAKAQYSAYFELNCLRQHYHPTVSLYATQILNGELIRYQGDPLKDFTLIRFLDRFVFKNPKDAETEKQGAHPTFGQRKFYKPKGIKSLSVTSYNYIHAEEKSIPADEKFLYMYLNKKYGNRDVKDENDDSDVDSVASDEFEEMLDRMGGQRKDLDVDDLDYMNDIGNNLKKTGKTKEKEESSSEESEDEDDDYMEDGDEELIEGLEEDDDAEELVFDDSEEKTKKKRKNLNMGSLFASAEEFSTLLEDEGHSKRKPGSLHALSNKDNAASKQINWEENRNRWLAGYDKALGKKRKYPRKMGESIKRNNKKFKN